MKRHERRACVEEVQSSTLLKVQDAALWRVQMGVIAEDKSREIGRFEIRGLAPLSVLVFDSSGVIEGDVGIANGLPCFEALPSHAHRCIHADQQERRPP
jgi:hypothetical protein